MDTRETKLCRRRHEEKLGHVQEAERSDEEWVLELGDIQIPTKSL